MVSWMVYQAQFAPVEVPRGDEAEINGPEGEETAAPLAEEPAPEGKRPEPMAPPVPKLEEQRIQFEKPLYIAEFTSWGAGLRHWQLRSYDHGPRAGRAPIVLTAEGEPVLATFGTPFTELGLGDLADAVFEVENRDESGVR